MTVQSGGGSSGLNAVPFEPKVYIQPSQTVPMLLGGEISVQSELGKGSTFAFIVPVDV